MNMSAVIYCRHYYFRDFFNPFFFLDIFGLVHDCNIRWDMGSMDYEGGGGDGCAGVQVYYVISHVYINFLCRLFIILLLESLGFLLLGGIGTDFP